jgi:hypothetical protein
MGYFKISEKFIYEKYIKTQVKEFNGEFDNLKSFDDLKNKNFIYSFISVNGRIYNQNTLLKN